MGSIAVDLALMRDVLLPGITLSPGRAVAARVVSAQDGRGSLAIAGYLLEAELPRELRPGDALRLQVRDVDARRVLLEIVPATASDAPPPPAVTAVALPGGAVLSVLEDDEDPAAGGAAGSGERHRLALSLQIAGLGTVDLRFALDPAALALQASLAPGEPVTRAREHAGALRDALAQAVQRPASVTISPRREPLDVYA